MTLFALAGNIGGFGASGFRVHRIGREERSFSRLVSAAAPIPKPACRKKCRRVTPVAILCGIRGYCS